jgi:23S rRNA pseudouridine2605 synthase
MAGARCCFGAVLASTPQYPPLVWTRQVTYDDEGPQRASFTATMPKRRFKPRPTATKRHGRPFKPARPSQDREQQDARPRLQKVLAAAGLGSRRKCEEMISLGRVEVDRRVVKELGTRVDPTAQEIRVDGEPLPRPKRQYFMLNKPMGVVSTARDPAGRPRVTDLVKTDQRLFPIGRLDISSEGLILVTNDGELANLLAHPRYEVEKTYLAQVVGAPSRESLSKLERGVHLAEGYAHAKRVRIKSQHKQSSTLEIVLDEGRNREVRRLLARVGHKVLRLKRIAIGALRLGDLAPGEYRPLRSEEVRELKENALAASERPHGAKLDDRSNAVDKRAGRRKPPDHTVRLPAAQTNDAIARPQINQPERSPPHGFDDDDSFEPPHRPGTIIGDEETEIVKTSTAKGAASIKPIIDVRRGIFPGRQDDDFDDDELDAAPPAPPAAAPKKTNQRGHGNRRKFKPQETSRGNRRPAGRESKAAGRRKGRRR